MLSLLILSDYMPNHTKQNTWTQMHLSTLPQLLDGRQPETAWSQCRAIGGKIDQLLLHLSLLGVSFFLLLHNLTFAFYITQHKQLTLIKCRSILHYLDTSSGKLHTYS